MKTDARANEAGWTILESLAGLALIAIALTCCHEVLYRGQQLDGLAAEAALRNATAERLMEQTLAGPWDALGSKRLRLNPRDVGGHTGWHAEIRVTERRPGLNQVTVIVHGGSRTTELQTLVTPWRTWS